MSDLTDAILGRRTSKPALYSSQIPVGKSVQVQSYGDWVHVLPIQFFHD